MLKVAVCDDDMAIADYMKKCVLEICDRENIPVDTDVFTFIKKPIDTVQFEKIFLDAKRKINRQRLYFNYQYNKQEFKLCCMDILFFESSGRRITIHVKGSEDKVFNGKLSVVEEWAATGKVPFLRIHQSYLVNYHHISSQILFQQIRKKSAWILL